MNFELVEKEKLVGKLNQGVEYYKGDPGPKGDKGEPFRFEDFTPEQLEQLRGPKGDDGFIKFEELTPEQKEQLRGPAGKDGKDFTYDDFTQEQLNALKGQDGYTPQKGIDYFDGSNGLDGKDGKDGVSITHTWNGTSLSITSASGTSEMDLRGPIGPAGQDGQDYVLTQDDKTEIAGLVDLTNYATTTYVDNAISAIQVPDVSGFQTEEQVNTLINQALGVIENGTY